MTKEFRIGDIHDVIRTLPSSSVDLIYSSPPYGITNAAWDKPLDWKSLFPEMWRILKPAGIIALHCSMPFTYTLVQAWTPRYHYTWHKNIKTGFVNANKQPLRNTEEVLIYYRRTGTYNPQRVDDVTYSKPTGNLSSVYLKSPVKRFMKEYRGHYPSTLLEYPIRQPRQPITRTDEMMAFFVKTYTNAGDTVLDLTCHNQMLADVCVSLDRRFIGCDLDLICGEKPSRAGEI